MTHAKHFYSKREEQKNSIEAWANKRMKLGRETQDLHVQH